MLNVCIQIEDTLKKQFDYANLFIEIFSFEKHLFAYFHCNLLV